MNAEAIIDVRGMTKRFGDRTVVDHVDLTVRAGEIYGFLGPNGSGKTTFLRLLCGLLKADEGSGTCLGYDVISESELIKREVGYMTQRFSFWEDLSIEENLDFVARMYEMKQRRATVRQSIEELGLAGREKQLAGQLSGGWKQRLALAACLIHRPKLLLLDEPTAGVDPKARRDFWEQIHVLSARGLTFLITTHYMDEAERCHRLAYLAFGKLLARGTADEVVDAGRPNDLVRARPRLAPTGGETAPRSGCATGGGVRERAPCEQQRRGCLGARHRGLPPAALRLGGNFAGPRGRVHQFDGHRAGQLRPMSAHPKFSFARLRGIIVKEFTQMRRDRLTFAMMLGIPLLQLTLFGYAINADPRHLPVAVLMADHGPQGRTLLYAMKNSTYFNFVREAQTETEAHDLLARGQVQFVVNIPQNFSRDLLRGERPAILVEADATDPVATGNALSSLGALFNHALQHDLKGPLASLAATNGPIDLRIHALYNPEAVTQYNIVPGLMGVILTMTMIMITGLAITRERERGTMENLLSMPTRPSEVLIGKIVPYIFVGYVQVAVILLAAWFLFHVPMQGSILLLLVVALVFIAANLAMGITFSTIAKNQLQAMQMTFFVFLPSILLSGFMFPFRGMPQWAQWIGEIFPLTHFLRIVRGILLKGNGLEEVMLELWQLALFAAIVLTIGIKRYRQTLD